MGKFPALFGENRSGFPGTAPAKHKKKVYSNSRISGVLLATHITKYSLRTAVPCQSEKVREKKTANVRLYSCNHFEEKNCIIHFKKFRYKNACRLRGGGKSFARQKYSHTCIDSKNVKKNIKKSVE